MRRFNNPCKACGLPLGTTHDFEVPEHGYVCGVCYAIYTSISGNRYMYNLHTEYLREKNVKK
jgi:hypothetical protein